MRALWKHGARWSPMEPYASPMENNNHEPCEPYGSMEPDGALCEPYASMEPDGALCEPYESPMQALWNPMAGRARQSPMEPYGTLCEPYGNMRALWKHGAYDKPTTKNHNADHKLVPTTSRSCPKVLKNMLVKQNSDGPMYELSMHDDAGRPPTANPKKVKK